MNKQKLSIFDRKNRDKLKVMMKKLTNELSMLNENDQFFDMLTFSAEDSEKSEKSSSSDSNSRSSYNRFGYT